MTKITVNTELTIDSYLEVVNKIVGNYFISEIDEDNNVIGESYAPHLGIINTMADFYERCIVDEVYKSKFKGESAVDIFDKVIKDKDFLRIFNNYVLDVDWSVNSFKLDYANAYNQAMDMVATKNTSVSEALSSLKSAFYSITEGIKNLIPENALNDLMKLAEALPDGKVNEENIVSAYINSDRFKESVEASKLNNDGTKE